MSRPPLTPESIRLPGRVALVTGAARGIGRATAILLARAGARLALCDRAGDELDGTVAAVRSAVAAGLADLGRADLGGADAGGSPPARRGTGGTGQTGEVGESGEVGGAGELGQTGDDAGDAGDPGPVVGVLDVRDGAAVVAFVEQVGARHGRVDVLVNNAGGTFVAPFLGTSARGEATLIAENLTQATAFVRHVVPWMPPGGSIVNVTSIEAHQAAPGFAVYAAMKAGLASLTKSLALELAPLGLRVNAVAPDGVGGGDDALRDAFLAADVPYAPPPVPPLARFGEPVDAAAAVLFLAGDLARFVTGTTVHVDGGTHAAGGWHRTGHDPGPDDPQEPGR